MQQKFKHFPSVNLVWHDLKLQHYGSTIERKEECPRVNVVYPVKWNPLLRTYLTIGVTEI